MSRDEAIALTIVLAVLALAGMAWGWRRRSRRDRSLIAPLGEPTGDVLGQFQGFYVATTEDNVPLNRLAIRHLSYRAKLTVQVTTDGVALIMPGTPTIFIARGQLEGIARATWTIDRVVETDGLVVLKWRINDDTVVDSYLRLTPSNPTALIAALERVLPTSTATGI